LESSRSHRIIWLLEELGVEYETKHYPRDPKTKLAPKALMEIHPLGLSPIITDGDVTLAESGAIIEYLLYKYGGGRLKPDQGSPEWIQYIFWIHFAEGSFMPLRTFKLVLEVAQKRSPFFIKPIVAALRKKISSAFLEPRVARQIRIIEETLSKNKWLAGDEFTAADIQMAMPLIWSSPQLAKRYHIPKTMAYLEQIKARPTFIRTLEIGGPLIYNY
jgi:glutathione S-transferase